MPLPPRFACNLRRLLLGHEEGDEATYTAALGDLASDFYVVEGEGNFDLTFIEAHKKQMEGQLCAAGLPKRLFETFREGREGGRGEKVGFLFIYLWRMTIRTFFRQMVAESAEGESQRFIEELLRVRGQQMAKFAVLSALLEIAIEDQGEERERERDLHVYRPCAKSLSADASSRPHRLGLRESAEERRGTRDSCFHLQSQHFSLWGLLPSDGCLLAQYSCLTLINEEEHLCRVMFLFCQELVKLGK